MVSRDQAAVSYSFHGSSRSMRTDIKETTSSAPRLPVTKTLGTNSPLVTNERNSGRFGSGIARVKEERIDPDRPAFTHSVEVDASVRATCARISSRASSSSRSGTSARSVELLTSNKAWRSPGDMAMSSSADQILSM